MKKFSLIKTPDWPEYDIKVTLKPTFKCNHKCWFCSEYDNATKQWSKEQCDMVIHKLSEIPGDKRKIFFYFYGGEPTLSRFWEYLNESLVNTFQERELFIQTQTNMSLTSKRLEKFLSNINKIKSDKHTIDICSSYHLNKQPVEEFIDKMQICTNHNSCGLCFFSTELPEKAQTIREFNLLNDHFPGKIKLRFTETNNLVNKNIAGYKKYLDDDYLVGTDSGKSLEFRYWLREYPQWKKYFEQGWDFDVDGDIFNFSEVSGNNIHMKFKYMKCECGVKNMVIDHNLNVYHCNDDFYNNINVSSLNDVDISTYFNRYVRCLNSACYDGLDFTKTT